jgi:hypothetical protein
VSVRERHWAAGPEKEFCRNPADQHQFIRLNANLSIESFLFFVAALTLSLAQWRHPPLS